MYELYWKTQVGKVVKTNYYASRKNCGGAHLPLLAGWTRFVPDSLLATPG
jgi:hypothetical protein